MKRVFTIEEIFEENGPLRQLNESYRPRAAQIEASKHIHQGLQKPSNVIIEGETGLGKSYAYLIPICNEIAQNPNKKVVIATSGISLQEQLMYKDVPFVVNLMESIYPDIKGEIGYTLLKGRQNFLCNYKVDTLGIHDMKESMLTPELRSLKDFVMNTKTGDFSELEFVPDSQTLKQVACTDKGECLGSNCEFAQECYYNKAKRKLSESNIIITNYHMLFSDINSGGRILPEYDVIVLDEAHETANIYREFDSKTCSLGAIQAIRNKASQARNDNDMVAKALNIEVFQDYITSFEIFSAAIMTKYPKLESPQIINSIGELPGRSLDELRQSAARACQEATAASEMFDDVGEYSSDEDLKSKGILQSLVTMCDDMFNFISNLDRLMIDENNVIWIEAVNGTASLNIKKVDTGQSIHDTLLNRENLTAIFTSATITVAGSFDYIKKQTGIDLSSKDCITYIGHSPFNLTEQQLWYLPSEALNGNDREFQSHVPTHIMEIIDQTGGGALCLFTSVRAMRDTADILRRYKGRQYNIMVQGDAPRTKLIERFRDDKDSILLGTKSFFTGVDIQGDSLRCVIIDKLPFPQPTDPVQQKLMERDNAFYKYSIPEMVISLKQAVGRGVRSVNDRCVIAILDGRMSTAKYKARINNSFGYKKTGTRDVTKIGEFLYYNNEDDLNDIPF